MTINLPKSARRIKQRVVALGICLGGLLTTDAAFAQFPNVLVNEDFSAPAPTTFKDLSLLLNWSSSGGVQSAFTIAPKADQGGQSFNAIALTDTAVRYSSYLRPDGLKTSQCIDFPFGPISRENGDSLEVEFSAIWDQLTTGGEGGRIVAVLMHQVPDYDNLPFGVVDSVNQVAPFGRPAYNFRVLNRSFQGTNNYAHLFYGGGKDREGEFEKFNNASIGSWWLPGFISMPSGLSPGARPLFPAGPGTSWGPNSLASTSAWTKYRIVIRPEMCSVQYGPVAGPMTTIYDAFYPRLDADTNVTINRLNAHYGTSITRLPQLYQHWDTLRGLRLFWSGAQNAYISNVRVAYSGTVLSASKALSKSSLRAYPNPTSEAVELQLGEANLTISLHDAHGRLIHSEVAADSKHRISLNAVPSGI